MPAGMNSDYLAGHLKWGSVSFVSFLFFFFVEMVNKGKTRGLLLIEYQKKTSVSTSRYQSH